MEVNLDDSRVFMAFSFLFVILAALSTQRLGVGSKYAQQKREGIGNPDSLPMDTAFLDVQVLEANKRKTFQLLGISSNCQKCPLQVLKSDITSHSEFNLTVETNYPFTLAFHDSHGKSVCKAKSYSFGEHGRYIFKIHSVRFNNSQCVLITDKNPDHPYLPLLYAFLVIFGVCILWKVSFYIFRKYNLFKRWNLFQDTESLINADLGSPNFTGSLDGPSPHNTDEIQPEQPKKQRLKSLDAFRGLALTIMIFVNSGGGGYYFFRHARWNGLTVADLVFPWFVWIMGVSIVISFRSLRQHQVRPLKIFFKIVRRTLILFGLGLLVSNSTSADLECYRVPGVLQRIAASYFIMAMLQLIINPGTDYVMPVSSWWNPIRDVIALWAQWLVMLGFLAIYLVLTFALKMPGCPRGYIGPGGLAELDVDAYNCTGGTAGYIDRHFFGSKHIYQRPTCMKTYKTKVPYDPEGALGTITSAFLVFLGVQAGYTLFAFPNHVARMERWILWSFLLGCIALALTGTQNEGVIPLNKNLWSVSFIFATGGMAFLLLTFCYLTIDVLGWWSGAPFCYPGMNSIIVYVGSEILANYFPFSWKTSGHVQHAEMLAMNLLGTTVWIIISYYFYYIKFFVKI